MKGVVYQLYNEELEPSYIGSTQNLVNRIYQHKSCCCNKNGKAFNNKVYRYIRENGGIHNWSFKILDEIEYENKLDLLKLEKKYILENKNSLNIKIPNQSSEEYYQNNRIERIKKQKEYNLKNAAKISLYKKEWYKQKKQKEVSE